MKKVAGRIVADLEVRRRIVPLTVNAAPVAVQRRRGRCDRFEERRDAHEVVAQMSGGAGGARVFLSFDEARPHGVSHMARRRAEESDGAGKLVFRRGRVQARSMAMSIVTSGMRAGVRAPWVTREDEA